MAIDKKLLNNLNIKEQLQAKEEELKFDDRVLGLTLLTNPGYISSSRSIMFTLHMKQFVNLNKPEFPKVFTNYENMVGKYSSNYYKVENDSRVIAKVNRFEEDPEHLYTLFLYDKKKDYYDVIEKKLVEDLTEKFGFAYNNKVMDELKVGDSVDKGKVLYKSLSYDEDMNYCYGLNATVMYLLENHTIEDAAICSESFSKRMISKEVEHVMVPLNDNDVLCNLYGNKEVYKGFPDIGEDIYDSVLCAKRRIQNNQILYDLKKSNLKKLNPTSDTPFYCSGKILDVVVYCNKTLSEIEENDFNRQLLRYMKNQHRYYEELHDVCKQIVESGSKCSDTIKYLYRRSTDVLDPNCKWRMEDGGTFSHMCIGFLVERDIPLTIGGKITGTSGDKSIISTIWPDSQMPFIYVDGKPKTVDLILNTLGVINRVNPWQLYQLSINFICNRVVERLKTMDDMTEKETLLFDIIRRFNTDESVKAREYYDSLTNSQKEEFFADIFAYGIYINIPPLWEKENEVLFDRINNIYITYPWIERYDVYVNKFGRTIKMFNKHVVAEKYLIKMKQTSKKGFSSRATGTISKQGVPSKSSKAKVNLDQWSHTPIRVGIDENINTCIGTSSDVIANLHMFHRSSVMGRKNLSKRLSTSLDQLDDFNKSPDFKNRNVEILQAYLKCLGYRLTFKDTDSPIKFTSELTEIFSADDGKTFIGTEEEYDLYEVRAKIKRDDMPLLFLGSQDEFEKEVDRRLEEWVKKKKNKKKSSK